MNPRSSIAIVAICCGVAVPAAALDVVFRESAPKDSFTILNDSACETGPMTVTIDLSASSAGLIFDTTGSGAGVEVYQPFDLTVGRALVEAASVVGDGDTRIALSLRALPPGDSVRFTIDVDDTLTNGALGQIRVAGSEIAGAEVRVDAGGTMSRAVFTDGAVANLALGSCQS